ncbi:MAG: hypothetical protein FRX49_03408 [Trebouxia sp. A1-2]|nr:MAG: hypothetical protein FRX49_03408 [Trebouxia sp. A1-2]
MVCFNERDSDTGCRPDVAFVRMIGAAMTRSEMMAHKPGSRLRMAHHGLGCGQGQGLLPGGAPVGLGQYHSSNCAHLYGNQRDCTGSCIAADDTFAHHVAIKQPGGSGQRADRKGGVLRNIGGVGGLSDDALLGGAIGGSQAAAAPILARVQDCTRVRLTPMLAAAATSPLIKALAASSKGKTECTGPADVVALDVVLGRAGPSPAAAVATAGLSAGRVVVSWMAVAEVRPASMRGVLGSTASPVISVTRAATRRSSA